MKILKAKIFKVFFIGIKGGLPSHWETGAYIIYLDRSHYKSFTVLFSIKNSLRNGISSKVNYFLSLHLFYRFMGFFIQKIHHFHYFKPYFLRFLKFNKHFLRNFNNRLNVITWRLLSIRSIWFPLNWSKWIPKILITIRSLMSIVRVTRPP